jgi:integrase/recombinase XerD
MTALDKELDRYLKIRRGLGFGLESSERVLRRFVAFADRRGEGHVTPALFLAWQEEFGKANRNTWAARLGMVRQFALWLSGIDPKHQVPPKGLLPWRYRRARPYIYSDHQVTQIVAEAGRLPSPTGLRGLTFSVLFGLIAVTGLRVGEALGLDNDDLDTRHAVLTVRRGKLGKPRLIPLSKSTVAKLVSYTRARDRLLGNVPKPFFVSDVDTGKRPDDCSARYNFAMVRQRLGLTPEQRFNRHGRGPRIHDLRHTFAVRTMVDWYRTGKDPDREMLKLSTYLGHEEPAHTYWYMEAVPELLEMAAARASRALKLEGTR